MTTSERVSYLMELIQCNYDLILWEHDLQENLLSEHAPEDLLLYVSFLNSKCLEVLTRHAVSHISKGSGSLCPPVIITDMLDLMWFAVFDLSQPDHGKLYVVGPAFTSEYSKQLLYPLLTNRPDLLPQYQNILNIMQRIATISTQNLLNYAVSMHYAVTGQHIHSTDIIPLTCTDRNPEITQNRRNPGSDESYLGTWQSEQQLLKCIEDGNVRPLEPFSKSRRVSYGITLERSTSLRKEKDSYLIFLALCVNTAIKGGLSPTVAYTVQNTYVQKIEDCSSQTMLIDLGNHFFVDLAELVHNAKSQVNLSQPIKSCCDYIGLHLFDELCVDDLASRVGYSNYYLTRKFKQETGLSLNEYIRQKRIDQAKFLLATTDLSVETISERLHFCSRSYFSEIFQRIVGMRPNEYRNQNIRT